MDPSTRGPFIRGMVVATLLALVIIGNAGFRRAGISFDYDIESETTRPDGEEVVARWSGNGTEHGGRRRYETSDEEGAPLDVFGHRNVKNARRHFEVKAGDDEEEIEGYKTRHYRVTEIDTIWLEDTRSPVTARIVIDYWMAQQLERVAEPVLTFTDSVMRSRIGLDEPRESGRHTARRLKLRGTPLRVFAEAVVIDPDGKRWESQITSELSDISRGRRFELNF